MNPYKKNTWAMSAMDAKQKAEWMERMERLGVKDDEAVRSTEKETSDAGAEQPEGCWLEITKTPTKTRAKIDLSIPWQAIVAIAIGILLGLLLLELKAQDKYSAARKRLSVPEIVLPDINISDIDTLALRQFIQAMDTVKFNTKTVKE